MFSGIVTNGGVASTLRDAHVRDFTTVLLSDGCAAFDARVHDATVSELSSVSPVMTCADFIGRHRGMSILPARGVAFTVDVPVLIVGAGAAGLTAALAARDAGADVLVLERDASAQGSTALSSGLIPAAGTKVQKAKGIADDPAQFAADIQAKAKGKAAPLLVDLLSRMAAPTIDWLAERHGVPFTLVEGFLYPGHSVLRMHGTPRRTGAELMACLTDAARTRRRRARHLRPGRRALCGG